MAIEHPVTTLLRLGAQRPDEPWLTQPNKGAQRTWTWGQAADEIGRLAAALRGLGLPPGTRIAMSGRNTAHYLMADYAITLAGYVGVGLYPMQSVEHVRYILDHSETAVLFVGPTPNPEQFRSAVPAGVKTIALPYDNVGECDAAWDDFIAGHEPIRDFAVPDPGELLTLVYTSGSTGDPKGVMITHGNMLFAADGFMSEFPSLGHERLFSYLPLAHIFERVVIGWSSTLYAAEVYFMEKLDTLGEELKAWAPTRFYGVPLVFMRIQAKVIQNVGAEKLRLLTSIPIVRSIVRKKLLEETGLRNAKMVLSGSAPMPLPVLEFFKNTLGIEVLQGYGLSETALYASAERPGASRIGSVGKALPGVDFVITDEGELLMKHGAIMTGYFKQPDKTREALTDDGYLRTGDRARIDEDGYLFITGRTKEIFKTLKGKYVAPAPIEGAMRRNSALDQVSLVGAGLNQPILLATLTPEAATQPRAEVEKSLVHDMKLVNASLEPHEKIGKIVILKEPWTVDNGLLTPTLKVRSHAVEERFHDLIKAQAAVRSDLAWE